MGRPDVHDNARISGYAHNSYCNQSMQSIPMSFELALAYYLRISSFKKTEPASPVACIALETR